MIVYPQEAPPHTRTARAQPQAAHRRRHSRPHHRRHGEHSPTARQPHSNGLCSPPKEGPGPGSALRDVDAGPSSCGVRQFAQRVHLARVHILRYKNRKSIESVRSQNPQLKLCANSPILGVGRDKLRVRSKYTVLKIPQGLFCAKRVNPEPEISVCIRAV